jgi:uncharacterized protein (TIGR02453 family)
MKSASNIPQILAFLRQLAINNDRAWFKARKEQFDALRKPWEQDMERLIALVADFDPQARGLTLRDSVYRIYRDIRFSHDKSPYKTYFSAVIGKGGRHTVQSCYYVHFGVEDLMLCGGIWWPEKPILDQLRGLIDAEPQEFLDIVNNPAITSRYQWMSQSLKSMPKGYPKDHPLAQYLKMKEYLLVDRLDESYFDCEDWVERVASDLQPLKPLHDFLNYVFE